MAISLKDEGFNGRSCRSRSSTSTIIRRTVSARVINDISANLKMATVTPRAKRQRQEWELTPAGPLKERAKRTVRLPGTPLMQEEMRMALTVMRNCRNIKERPKWRRKRKFKSPADEAAFLCKTDAQSDSLIGSWRPN